MGQGKDSNKSNKELIAQVRLLLLLFYSLVRAKPKVIDSMLYYQTNFILLKTIPLIKLILKLISLISNYSNPCCIKRTLL